MNKSATLKRIGLKPVIRIWAPDAAVNPVAYANMKRLADNFPLLEGILRENGVAAADIMPALGRGRWKPDDDELLQYEIFAHPPTLKLSVEGDRIREAIDDALHLFGHLCPPFTPEAARDAHIKNHALSLLLTRSFTDK